MLHAPEEVDVENAVFAGAPLEADPVDWVDQQQSAPLPDDEYPRADDFERMIA